MSYNVYEYLSKEDSKLKWIGDLDSLKYFIAIELNLSGKWSSTGGDVKAFTSESDVSNESEIIKMKWYQGKKFLLFQGVKAKQIEEEIQRKMQSNSNGYFEEGEANSSLQLPNLHTNDKLIEATNDLKIQYRELRFAIGQNKNAISSVQTMCRNFQSSSDNAHSELDRLRKEYELIRLENANLKEENAKCSERMNNVAYIVSDLNTKIKVLEEEKASLITAVRLINEDQSNQFSELNQHTKDHNNKPPITTAKDPVNDETTKEKTNPNEHNTTNGLIVLDESSVEPNSIDNNHNLSGVNIKDGNTSVMEMTSRQHNTTDANKQHNNSVREHKQPKNTVPCPFLIKRGYCLKGSSCDFSHFKVRRNVKKLTSPKNTPRISHNPNPMETQLNDSQLSLIYHHPIVTKPLFPSTRIIIFPLIDNQCFILCSQCFSTPTYQHLCLCQQDPPTSNKYVTPRLNHIPETAFPALEY